MSHQDELKNLIELNIRRLNGLKERQASSGLTTAPAILLEIEQIEAQLAELQSELAELESKPEPGAQPQIDEGMTRPPEVQIDLPPMGLKDFGPAHTALLQRLYMDEQRVLIEREFSGGFGGTKVLLVRLINQRGRQLVRQIVKIGPPLPLQKEQQNYEEHVGKAPLFVVGQVTRYAEWQGLGGIIYNFVGDSRFGGLRTLETYFQDEHVSAADINRTLEDLLDKTLGKRWYHETEPYFCFFDDEYEPHLVEHLRVKIRPHSQDALLPADQTLEAVEGYRQLKAEAIPAEHAAIRPETLVQIEGLVVTKVKPDALKLQHPTRPGIVVKVETTSTTNFVPGQAVTLRGNVRYNRSDRLAQIVRTAFANFPEASVDPQAETLKWGDQTYPNPLHLYPQILGRTLEGKKSLVHGDLHLRNILVDEAGHGWLIDFALVKERHNLYDFIKLETYIRQMVLSQPQYTFSFAEYLQFEAALLDEAVAVPDDRMLRKAYEVIQKVRGLAARYAGRGFDEQYWPVLFLYSLAMLKYTDNHGAKATRLTFGTAGVIGKILADIQTATMSDLNVISNLISSEVLDQVFATHDLSTKIEALSNDPSPSIRQGLLRVILKNHSRLPKEYTDLVSKSADDDDETIRISVATSIFENYEEVGTEYEPILIQFAQDKSDIVRQKVKIFGGLKFSLLSPRMRLLIFQHLKIDIVKGSGMLLGQPNDLILKVTNQHETESDTVKIEIQPSAEYNVFNPNPVTIPKLRAGHSEEVNFRIEMKTAGRVTANYKVNGEIREPPLHINVVKDNPYVYGDPVKEETAFFGRQKTLDHIIQAVTKPTKQDILIIGERRTGKTSLLYQLQKRLEQTFIPVYIVLNTIEPATESILDAILRKITQSLIKYDILEKEWIEHHYPYRDFVDNIQEVILAAKANLADVKIILLLDEADYLLKVKSKFSIMRELALFSDKKPRVDERLQNILRAALQSKVGADLRAVVAGTTNLSTYVSQRSSPFFNHFRFEPLKPLTMQETRDLIVKPAAALEYTYTKEAVERIINLGGGQPYYCQALCYESFESASQAKRDVITEEDAAAAELKITEDLFNSYLSGFWDRTNKIERHLLSALTHNEPLKSVTRVQIKRLLDWQLVIESEGNYRFASGLIEKWTGLAVQG
jgi:Cdc6-like AAA superfamily ATPase